MYYHHDWWFGTGLKEQIEQARTRCLKKRFPDADPADLSKTPDAERFYKELEHRIIVYLRDGFTYELGEAIDGINKSYLLAQCIPGDEAWQAGVFVVSVPFEEVARVEVFAVHPNDKPQETAKITGFHAKPES
jgi:hypothetical protein